MNFNLEITWEEVEKLADKIIFETYGRHLIDVETKILHGAYLKKKYGEIEDERSDNYLKEVGKRTWDVLSGKLGEKVNKSNFVQILLRYKMKQYSESEIYIERDNVDSLCKKEITQPGALIHIKSSPKMGKTLLLGKLLNHASQNNYRIAKLDLHFAAIDDSTDLATFTKWLCDEIFYNLYPDDGTEREKCKEAFTNSGENLTRFFQTYLLKELEAPLVLAIDAFEKLFNSKFFSTFCSYIRGWHEKSKSTDSIGTLWRKLRIVLVYSTADTYPNLQTNLSPFNVGVAIDLPNFSETEVKELAKIYELDKELEGDGLKDLSELVDGHPYLIRQAFNDIKNKSTPQSLKDYLNEFVKLAPTEEGIYSNYLRQQLQSLKKKDKDKNKEKNLGEMETKILEDSYKKVLAKKEENGEILIEVEVAFELQSMGLVKFKKNRYYVANDLYHQYFSAKLL